MTLADRSHQSLAASGTTGSGMTSQIGVKQEGAGVAGGVGTDMSDMLLQGFD